MLKFEGNSAHDPCVKKLTALGPGHSLTKAKKLHALFSYFDVLEFSLWSGPYLLSLYTGSRHLRFEDHIHWNYKKITLCRLHACCHVVIQSAFLALQSSVYFTNWINWQHAEAEVSTCFTDECRILLARSNYWESRLQNWQLVSVACGLLLVLQNVQCDAVLLKLPVYMPYTCWGFCTCAAAAYPLIVTTWPMWGPRLWQTPSPTNMVSFGDTGLWPSVGGCGNQTSLQADQ